MTHIETLAMQDEMDRMVGRIEAYQQALRLPDTRFCARFGQRFVGTPKTWRDRLCGRAWAELGKSLPKWHGKLTAFVAEIEGTSDLSEFFEALPIYRYGLAAFDGLQGQRNDRRVAWLIGPTGVGKSWTMKRLAADNRTAAAYIHVHRGARNSMMVIARSLARAVGATEASGGSATFVHVIAALAANPLTLLIDDVHEGGVLMLQLLKHLIDDTRVKLILGTYPTAWNALVNGSTDAHSEAQQLLGRSLKPVVRTWIRGLSPEDVASYLRVALGGNGECRVMADRITPLLQRNGNLRVLADAIEIAAANAAEDGVELDADLVEAAVHEVCPANARDDRRND